MSRRMYHNRKAIAVLLGSIFFAITLVTGAVAVYLSTPIEDEPPAEESSASAVESDFSSAEEIVATLGPKEEEEPPREKPKRPEELRAAFLKPGVDFLAGETTQSAVAAEAAKAAETAVALGLNAIVVQTLHEGQFLGEPAGGQADALALLVQSARDKNLAVYLELPVLLEERDGLLQPAMSADLALIDDIAARAGALAERYQPDGVFLDEFTLPQGGAGFVAYQSSGSGMGYDNYLLSMTEAAFSAAAKAVRAASPKTAVGLYTSSVWANKTTNEQGSETAATYQTLTDGSADTKAWVERELVDFIAVDTPGATDDGTLKFSNVLSWWGGVAEGAGIKAHPVHAASKAAGTWTPDELAQQYLEAKNVKGYGGSVFDSLSALAQNPKGSTDNLKRALNKEIDLSYILEKLELTKPNQLNSETTEPQYVLTGASDPDYELTMNGEPVERNDKGYFNITVMLDEGPNTFRFLHKEQDLTYTITRKSEVLKEVTPTGQSPVTGGMTINITAMAYPGATVYATLNGQNIPMSPAGADEEGDESDNNNSSYVRFTGSYKTSVVSSERSLGKIVVYASYNGISASMEGASVTVLPKVSLGEGQLVQVISSSAETFPNDTLNDTSVNTYFPLCAGAMDYTISDELEYSDGKKTFTYYQLNSGRRVYADDIDVVQDRSIDLNGNKVTGMNITSGSGATKVTFNTKKQVSYTLTHKTNSISIEFHYTDSVTAGTKVGDNPLFTSAEWSGSTVTLQLSNPAAFIGYTAEYSGGDLIFRFKNSPGGLSGARVYIDVGHSDDSVGADGNLGNWNECDINKAISKQLKSILENSGATVKMLDNSSYVTLENRLSMARSFNPTVSISVHTNSHTSSSTSGSEAFYFNSFSGGLASRVSSGMSSALGISNRGGKKGLYYMTRTTEFPAILSESGFITNYSDYEMMINADYQYEIAQGIARGIDSYLAAAVGSSSGSGTADGGYDGSDEDDEDEPSDEEVRVSAVSLDKTSLKLKEGETKTLEATIKPSNADETGVTWESDDEDVATVSQSGKVTAVGEGTATITVKTDDKGKTATCKVTVSAGSGGDSSSSSSSSSSTGQVKSIVIDQSEMELSVGDGSWLTVTIEPESAADAKLVWSSSDSKIVAVENDGTLTAVAKGTATITVKTADGAKSAKCKVTVIE